MTGFDYLMTAGHLLELTAIVTSFNCISSPHSYTIIYSALMQTSVDNFNLEHSKWPGIYLNYHLRNILIRTLTQYN